MNADEVNSRVLEALRSIQRDVADIKSALSSRPGGSPRGDDAPRGGEVASDRDLDGQHGDFTIKFDPKPKYWTGDSYVGYRLSEIPDPDYLDAQAKYLDACAYMASQDKDERRRKTARFKSLDAARCRGWAARVRRGDGPADMRSASERNGANGAASDGSVDFSQFGDDDIPF